MTHLKVASDVDGIFAILDWLSFVPKTCGSPIPILPSTDPVDRLIDFMPPKAPYDPRWMILGRQKPGTSGVDRWCGQFNTVINTDYSADLYQIRFIYYYISVMLPLVDKFYEGVQISKIDPKFRSF